MGISSQMLKVVMSWPILMIAEQVVHSGEIQFGVLINDDLTGVPNCDVQFYGKGRSRVAKIIALKDLSTGEALSMDYGVGYWQYSLSHYYTDPDSATKLLHHVANPPSFHSKPRSVISGNTY